MPIEIAPSGNDDSTRLNQAIADATGRDSIVLLPGQWYLHNIVINQPCQIKGNYRDNTVLLPAGSGNMFNINAPNVNIKDLSINGLNKITCGIYGQSTGYGSYQSLIENVAILACQYGIANQDIFYSSKLTDVLLTYNQIGLQLIGRAQYTTMTRVQSYNNTIKNAQVGDGTTYVHAIEFVACQLENDTTSGAINLGVNCAQVKFSGYMESNADSTAHDVDVVVPTTPPYGGSISQLDLEYYSNGDAVTNYSIVLNGQTYLTLRNTCSLAYVTGVVHDVLGTSSIVRINTLENGVHTTFNQVN